MKEMGLLDGVLGFVVGRCEVGDVRLLGVGR